MQGKKRVFALIDPRRNRVNQLITEVNKIEDEWTPGILDMCVDVTDMDPQPKVGMMYNKKKFELFDEEAALEQASPQVQTTAALSSGLKVDGKTFHAGGPAWRAMRDEAQHVATFGEFTNGTKKLTWDSKDGPVDFNSTEDFMKTVKALGQGVAKWQEFSRGDGKGKKPEKELKG